MEEEIKELEKLAMMKNDSDVAFLDEAEKTNEHLSAIHKLQEQSLDVLNLLNDKEAPEPPEMPEFPSSISISNLPDIQRVEVINQKAPVVNVSVPKIIVPDLPKFPPFPEFPPIPETRVSILTDKLEQGLITISELLKELNGLTEKNGMKEMVLQNHGYSSVNIKNNAGANINPATEDTLSGIGTISAANSTTTPLGIDGVFTGTAVDTTNFVTANVVVYADVASATDGFSMQWSVDGTNWDVVENHTFVAGVGIAHLSRCKAQYFRVVYTNGGTGQASFRISTILKRNAVSMTYEQLSSTIDATHDAALVRAVLNGKNPAGVYGDINRTTGGNLKVSIEETDGAANVAEAKSTTATLSNVNSSASSVSLLALNANRKMAIFYNDSTAILYLKFGATASTTSYTVQIASQGSYTMPLPCYTGAIDGIWASANGAARITELT